MKLTKKQGGAIIAGYEWKNDGDVVEVPDELACELLAIRGHDFTVVPPDGEISEIDPAAELSESPPRGKPGPKAVREKGTEGNHPGK